MLLAANVSGILFLTFLLLIRNVSVESVSVTAAVGDTVVLPCQINSNPEDVYWRYSDVRNVCNIIKGKADFNGQDPAFKGRVNIFPLEIKNGNFSIRLDKVSKSDEGPYICSSPSISLRENLELKVTDKADRKEGTTVPSSGQSPGRADGLLMFLLGSALLYSLSF